MTAELIHLIDTQYMTNIRPTVNLSLSPTVDRCTTEIWPTLDRYSGRYIDRHSADSWSLHRPTTERLWTDYQPKVDRLSTNCRLTVNRLSTGCRPIYRSSIDRLSTDISTAISVESTYVNMISVFFACHVEHALNRIL